MPSTKTTSLVVLARRSRSSRLCTVALALVLAAAMLANVLWFSQLRHSLSKAVLHGAVVASPRADCAPIDENHRDPLFRRHAANCSTQSEIVATLRELVFTATRLFQTHNVTYFLDSGTLLGAFRNQSVIAYDTDADMSIDEAGFDYIRQNKAVVPEPYFLAVYASGDLYPGSQREKGIPIRLVHKPTALYVDVFVFITREDEKNESNNTDLVGPYPSWAFDRCVHCTRYYNEGMQLLVPRDWIYPPVDCVFEGVTLQCPRETEKYLQYMFGDDFRIPIQYSQ